jgi:hypothetical protein
MPSRLDGLCSFEHTDGVALDPKELQNLLDELAASRASRRSAWTILQELRAILKDVAGVELPPPAIKNISIEGRIVRDGVRKTLAQRKSVIEELVKAIKQYRQSQDHQSIHALNKALERAEEQLTPNH